MWLLDKNLCPDAIVEAKPFTPDLNGLIAWLETQHPEKRYCWERPGVCLLSQFADVISGGTRRESYVDLIPQTNSDHPQSLETYVAYPRPRTFGAALERARAVLGAA